MKSYVNRKSVDEICDKFSESISSEMAICEGAHKLRVRNELLVLSLL